MLWTLFSFCWMVSSESTAEFNVLGQVIVLWPEITLGKRGSKVILSMASIFDHETGWVGWIHENGPWWPVSHVHWDPDEPKSYARLKSNLLPGFFRYCWKPVSKNRDHGRMVLGTVFFPCTTVDMDPLPSPSYQLLSANWTVLPEILGWNSHIEDSAKTIF